MQPGAGALNVCTICKKLPLFVFVPGTIKVSTKFALAAKRRRRERGRKKRRVAR
jgi:hypothetical protein